MQEKAYCHCELCGFMCAVYAIAPFTGINIVARFRRCTVGLTVGVGNEYD